MTFILLAKAMGYGTSNSALCGRGGCNMKLLPF
uniref:Uncharacterized protein n=1 Tax=Anguilla anguilla TaxID=7936 RepID=A0A0E9P944_ANGAN